MAKHLAVVSSNEEFETVKKFLEKKPEGEKVTVFCPFNESSSSMDTAQINIEFKTLKDFLSESDMDEIEFKASVFAQQWYKTDGLEEKLSINGISMAFLEEIEMCYWAKNLFAFLKALGIAIKKENPVGIIACKATESEKAVALLKPKNTKIVLLEAEKISARESPNFTIKKLYEIKEQIGPLLSGMKNKNKNAKTVFVRSRGYLGELKEALQKEPCINVVSLDEFLLKKMLNPANMYKFAATKKKMRWHFEKIIKEHVSNTGFRKGLVFEGINFADFFDERMKIAVERDWSEFVFLIENLAPFFEKNKPSVVVLWEDFVAFERICALLAKRVGAKSLVVQHSSFRETPKKGDWVTGFAPLTADKFAAWGKDTKELLVKHKVSEKNIIITGAPKLDAIFKKRFNPEIARKKLGIEKGEKLIVIATDMFFEKKDIKEAINVIGNYSKEKLRFVLKIHPVEKKQDYFDIAKQKDVLHLEIRLYDLLSACDAVITNSSSVGVESLIMGKPVIVFGKKLHHYCVFIGSDAVLRPKNARELEKALDTSLKGDLDKNLEKRMKKFVYNYAFKQDGKATERVVSLVKSMV